MYAVVFYSQRGMSELVNSGRYDTHDNFTVVIQPFFRNVFLPVLEDGRPDHLTFFSVDCFHFSERGHAEMAIALWNNMLEPVGSKQNYNNFTYDRSKIHCPTKEHPFIFTQINSVSGADCPTDTIPAWAAAVLAVGGLIIGWIITWIIFYYRERKNRKRNKSTEMNGTKF
uniref:Si:ch211-214p16.3 n=1 Tax=Cyprinus carpio TaxID=7962 RepID=A0A8C1W9H7_CYPCA